MTRSRGAYGGTVPQPPEIISSKLDLTSWPAYSATVGEPSPQSQRVFEFRAHWQRASAFQDIIVPSFSTVDRRTIDAYAAFFKVSLAYTAHEQLAKVLGRDHAKMAVPDQALADAIRGEFGSCAEFSEALDLEADGNTRILLKRFWENTPGADPISSPADVRVIGYGIRNALAHRSLTPSRVRVSQSQRRIGLIRQLSDALLARDDADFTVWVTAAQTS